MKVTLVDVEKPRALFDVVNACEGPVSCCGMDLRHNRSVQELMCGTAAPNRGIPQLELTVSTTGDLSRLLRYMQENRISNQKIRH